MTKKSVKLHDLTFEPFINALEIAEKVEEMGINLNLDYAEKNPLFIGVLNGAFVFCADFVRQFKGDCETSFIKLASYDGLSSSGDIKTRIGLEKDIRNRHVIIVEDIIDTGNTMHAFLPEIEKLNPASVQVASFLVKPDAMQHDIFIKYKGFDIPNKFVVGYGLDYDGLGRNLKGIYQLKS